MKKFTLLFVFALLISYVLPLTSDIDFVTCTGADPCKACKNCNSCKHCHKDSGTCGVCRKK